MPLEIRIGSYIHTEATPSILWTVPHNLGTLSPCVDVWVDDGFGNTVKMLADSVTAIDANTVEIGFTVAKDGQAMVT